MQMFTTLEKILCGATAVFKKIHTIFDIAVFRFSESEFSDKNNPSFISCGVSVTCDGVTFLSLEMQLIRNE
jgi:hypothetical protein